MQIPLRTLSSVDAYVRNREWRDARLSNCPLHPSGGCSLARHGSYSRVTPRGYGSLGGTALRGAEHSALLPDFLAARLPGLLISIEDSVTFAFSAKSVEAAADALRGPDITLPGAVRWLRRRIRAVRAALAHIALETATGVVAMEAALGTDLDGGGVLLGLRRLLSPQTLSAIPAPLGFQRYGAWAAAANTGRDLTERPPLTTVRWSMGTKPDG